MKRLFYILFVILVSNQIFASIQRQICDPNTLGKINLPKITIGYDPNTSEPITLPEIMVGMDVSIVIHSDANDLWSGGLFIKGQDRALGQLAARRGNSDSHNWSNSCLEAAGKNAYVIEWKDSNIWGFDCYTDDLERQSGNWFVLDYTALEAGECTIGFYDHRNSDWTITDPNLSIHFQNTPTRDLNSDKTVNFDDFVIFSSQWNKRSNPDDPNLFSPADFSGDGFVGLEDVVMFADYWLWGTPGWKPAEEPVMKEVPSESIIVCDVMYSLICDPDAFPFTDPNSLNDANSLSEITLEVGESVIIYIDKSSLYEDVRIFDMEVTISDPKWGSIDTAASGTAEILAYPRMETFDSVGPGYEQTEGIAFFAANLSSMWDGDMAGFVYTATETGTVTLDLINYLAAPAAKLKSMVIHQFQPVVPMLEQIYTESPDLQESIPEETWEVFIDSVQESIQ